MRVMPDVCAGSRAAADSLPAIEPPVQKSVAGAGREDRRVEQRAVEEPERQRRVVPCVPPQACLAGEAVEVIRYVTRHRRRRREAACVRSSVAPLDANHFQVREAPDDDKRDLGRLPRRKFDIPAQFTNERLREPHGRVGGDMFRGGAEQHQP